MDAPLPLLVALAASLLLVMGLALALVLQRGQSGRASRRRNAVALRGEGDAEALLEAHGYRIVDRQVTVPGVLHLDGQPVEFVVRLDLLVRRRRRHFIAEVKTGERAPDPTFPATRRQLREYAALLPDHGVLLVDMERGVVTEVGFD